MPQFTVDVDDIRVHYTASSRKAYIDLLVECFLGLYGYWDSSTEGLLYRGLGQEPPIAFKRTRVVFIRNRVEAHARRLLYFLGPSPFGKYKAYISNISSANS